MWKTVQKRKHSLEPEPFRMLLPLGLTSPLCIGLMRLRESWRQILQLTGGPADNREEFHLSLDWLETYTRVVENSPGVICRLCPIYTLPPYSIATGNTGYLWMLD